MKGIYDKSKRTKRFILLFCEWWKEYDLLNKLESKSNYSWYEYDTFEEAKEEIDLIEEFYKNQLLPISPENIKNSNIRYTNGDYTNGGKFWGYLLLDYEKERAILDGGSGYNIKTVSSFNSNLKELDDYFRGPDEIPEGYKWDEGEYLGWLRFRWGDGKNAIDYKEPSHINKSSPLLTEQELYDIYDDDWTVDEEEEIKKKFNLD